MCMNVADDSAAWTRMTIIVGVSFFGSAYEDGMNAFKEWEDTPFIRERNVLKHVGRK